MPDVVLVRTPSGDAHIRADVADELGIVTGERIGPALWDVARWYDYQAEKAERRRRA